MTPLLGLLAEAQAAGVQVRLEGHRIRLTGPKAAEPLARQLLYRKAEVLEALRRKSPGPDPASLEAWDRTVDEVGGAWDVAKSAGREPPWPAWNDPLTDQVGVALRGGDPGAVQKAVNTWRSAWLEHLEAAEVPAPSKAGRQSLDDRLLDLLRQRPGLNVEELVAAPGHDRKAVVKALDRLHGLGWIRRLNPVREYPSRWAVADGQAGRP